MVAIKCSLSLLKRCYFGICCKCLSTENVPVITVPVYIQSKLKALEKKEQQKRVKELKKRSQGGNKNIPVIQCRRSDFNHYLNQVYGKYDTVPLVSQHWKSKKYEGDYFTITAFGRNPSIPIADRNTQQETFASLNLNKTIVEQLENLNIRHPTLIQLEAIPKLLEYQNVVCSAETGSGKTIAYLAPVIHHLYKLEEFRMNVLPFNSPLALILVPSRELAEQVAGVARKLAGDLTVKLLLGGHYEQNKPVGKNNIIMVSTLGTIQSLADRGVYDMRYVRHVVIDEADTMLDDSFSYSLKRFLCRIQFQETPPSKSSIVAAAQLILSSATFPTNLDEALSGIIDTTYLEKAVTNHLHRIVPHVPQKFLRVRGSRRTGPLMELVKSDFKQGNAVMIFCNRSYTCDWMHEFLADMDVPSVKLHSDMSVKERDGMFEKFQSGEYNIVTCTDVASRGLDTTRVKHIINFDFPLHMSDYIHRVGRTGRLGSPQGCHATNFVCTPYNVKLVNAIELAIRKSKILPSVDANIKRKLESRAAEQLEF